MCVVRLLRVFRKKKAVMMASVNYCWLILLLAEARKGKDFKRRRIIRVFWFRSYTRAELELG